MTNIVAKRIEEINEISRQLLSRILAAQKIIQENKTIVNESNHEKHITEQELTGLMSERQSLISCFFEQHIKSEIALEPDLLNKMVNLDSELSSASLACKKLLSEQVIRLKKSKNVTKSYQKY